MRKPRESSQPPACSSPRGRSNPRVAFNFSFGVKKTRAHGRSKTNHTKLFATGRFTATCCAGGIVPMHGKDIFRVDKNTILCSFLRRTFARLTSDSRTLSQMAAPGPIDPRLQYAPPAPQQYPPSVDALRRVAQQSHAANMAHAHADLTTNPPRQPYYIPHQPHGPPAPPQHTHEPLDPALDEAESPLHDSDVHPSPDDARSVGRHAKNQMTD